MGNKVGSVKIANLYLYHAVCFAKETVVINCFGDAEEPNERLMRWLETQANIGEMECVEFRLEVTRQLKELRMDTLYERMGFVFEYINQLERESITAYLEAYPHAVKCILQCSLW